MAEREVKLGAAPSFRMPALDRSRTGWSRDEEPALRVSTTYLDTDDLRLTGWGVSLRHRTSDGWTVKLPQARRGAMLVRERAHVRGQRPPAARGGASIS